MRLFIDYQTTNEPWGGINTFFRNFKEGVEEFSDVITLVHDYRLADVILFGANSRGVKARISADDIITYGNSNAIVIHRLDGCRRGFELFVEATEMYIDGYVFQSKKGLEDYNFITKPSALIHNGANRDRFFPNVISDSHNKLKCLFVSWSNSLDKGFLEFANVATDESVDCTFVGRWPEGLDKKNVKIVPPINMAFLPKYYRENDVLIFPSRLESCSNVVLEALASCLPVVYYKGSGVEEIVGDEYGLAVDSFTNPGRFLPILKAKYETLTCNISRDRKQFSMQRTIEEYIKFFYSVKSR